MRLVKIFLYIICFFSFAWIILVFSGPIFIKKMIASHSNGRVTASNVTVTPKLGVKIGRLDYTFSDASGRPYEKGFSRSVNIFWSIIDEQPLLTAQVGPTAIGDNFLAGDVTIHTPPVKQIDFREIIFKTEIRDLRLGAVVSDKVNLQATYSANQGTFSDVTSKIELGELHGSGGWSFSDVSASLDNINLMAPIPEQDIILDVSTSILKNVNHDIELSDVEGSFKVDESGISFDYQIQSLLLPGTRYQLEKLDAEGFLNNQGYLENARMGFLGGFPDTVIEKKSSVLFYIKNLAPGEYNIRVVGDTKPIELIFGEKFIGNFPASDVDIELHLDNNKSQATLKSNILLKDHEAVEVSVNSEVILNVERSKKVLECFKTDCDFASLFIYYKAELEDEWILGSSVCKTFPCDLSSTHHKIRTSNTKELFEQVSRLKILNPLYAAYVYAAITTGEKIKDGHELTIN